MKRVRRVALVNRKGGCGKTTSLFSIAGVLASEEHKKVFVIDLDAQRNTTTTMQMNVDDDDKPNKTIMDVLKGAAVEEALCGVLWQPRGRRDFVKYDVDVLCGDAAIDAADGLISIDENELAEAGERINEYINANGYDWVLVDMPPSSKAINDFCFKYLADYMLVPFSPDSYSAAGYEQLMKDIADAQEVNPRARIIGAFLAKKDKRFGLHNAVDDELKEFDFYICDVPYESAVAESTYFGRPICLYKTFAKGSHAYRKIVKVVEERIRKNAD